MSIRNNNNLIAGVDIEEDTGRKVVPVFFQKHRNTVLEHIFFRLDSGADISTISKDDLNRLGYSMAWIEKNKKEAADIEIGVADKTKRRAFYVEIPLMNFMEKDFHNFKIFIVPEEGFDYSNLLGLDVSTEFTYITDNEGGVLEFYRINKSKFDNSSFTSKQRLGEINA